MPSVCNQKMVSLKQCLFTILLLIGCSVSFCQKTSIYKNVENKDTVIRGFKPKAGSDPNYRIYVGVAYSIVKHAGGKNPYAASHTVGLNYSLSENSFHPYYESFFPEVFGKWGITFKGGYDQIRRANYFGLGNETHRINPDIRFNWVRSHHQYVALGFGRELGEKQKINLSLLYDGIQVLNDKNRFISKSNGTLDTAEFNWQYFVGPRLSYTYSVLNDPELPTKGIELKAAAEYQGNLKRGGHSYARYSADADIYVPLSSEFSYVLKGGLSTITGNPDFYQYNVIGANIVRGYHRWRFYGKTAFYNQNELRWIREFDGSIRGRFGLFGLYDVGRVWMPGESSNKLHFGYGAGIILSPYGKVTVTAAYAISNEDKRFHFSAGTAF